MKSVAKQVNKALNESEKFIFDDDFVLDYFFGSVNEFAKAYYKIWDNREIDFDIREVGQKVGEIIGKTLDEALQDEWNSNY